MNIQNWLQHEGSERFTSVRGVEAKVLPQRRHILHAIGFLGAGLLRTFLPPSAFILACAWTVAPLDAQPVTNTIEFSGLSLAIPDVEGANLSGVQDTREISMDYDSIVSVSVTLNIEGSGSGAFNGDFYAYLTKGDDIAILLNRPGSTGTNPSGYGDNGLNVRFDDNAPNGDIHVYRLTLSGSHNMPLELGAQLTGSWAPDGRHVPPQLSLDTHSRTHTLDVFKGTDPNGEWTLFVADMESGGTGVLTSWGLEIAAVPEPRTMAMAILGSVLLATWCRKK